MDHNIPSMRKLNKRKPVFLAAVLISALVALMLVFEWLYFLSPTTEYTPYPAVIISGPGAPPSGEESLTHLPTLYIITPTYKRPQQIPELTRLAHTLMHIPKLYWLVADDSHSVNYQVVDLLKYTGLPFTYLLTPMPAKYSGRWFGQIPKGVANRNGAIKWLRKHAKEGVMYMADDDNTYDLRIFKEMRYTKKVSMFPVGLVTKVGLSTPVLRDGQLISWYDGWIGNRDFPVDMAGFAISIPFLFSVPDAEMPYTPGHEETGFLNNLHVTLSDLEFIADNCTKIYAWHTRTETVNLYPKPILDKKYDGTNLRQLQKVIY